MLEYEKIGTLKFDKEFQAILISPDGEAFRTDDLVLKIWHLNNGARSVSEITKSLGFDDEINSELIQRKLDILIENNISEEN